jgi:indole-3-glycerol phosphate synthase
LLICSILDKGALVEYIKLAHSLGLSALVEVHNEDEVKKALAAGARIIGVNNRNLKTFDVDISLSKQLRNIVPPNVLFVAESGIQTREDVAKMREIGANAVLVGEALMRGAKLEWLR